MDLDDEGYYGGDIPRSRRKLACMLNGKHFVNKNEAKALRKLKQKTGLTEEQIRLDTDYRKILSSAQDKGEQSTLNRKEKVEKRVMKKITIELKLAKEHPDCVGLFRKRMEEYRRRNPYYRY